MAPISPEGIVGLVVVARDGVSTCRSTEGAIGMEIVDEGSVRVPDPAGDLLRPCPGPSEAQAITAFAVALPDQYDDGLTAEVPLWHSWDPRTPIVTNRPVVDRPTACPSGQARCACG